LTDEESTTSDEELVLLTKRRKKKKLVENFVQKIIVKVTEIFSNLQMS